MREILFRGKRTDDGEWMCGNLTLWSDGTASINETLAEASPMYAVDPDTIGQFTGLIDKNGKKIFEGDIVNEYDMPKISNTGIVQWSNMFMGWHISKTRSMYCHEYMSYEVIGNIHDNPELLKGGESDVDLCLPDR